MHNRKRNESAEVITLMLFGLLLRLFAGRYSLTEKGLLPAGYDEYYHLRRILYTVDHFPSTLWFDSYLNFPYGQNLTWPPLLDLLSAALSLAFGQHTQMGVEKVSSFLPVAIGAITIAVVFYFVREIFDSRIALLSALMTAIAPYHISKTMLGTVDHHGLEVLLGILALLFLTMSLKRKENIFLYAILAGAAMAGLAYSWLGANIYLGIFLVYATVQITLDLKNKASSKETITMLLVSFGVTLLLLVPFANASWISPSFLGIAFILIAISVLFAFSVAIEKKRIRWQAFPLVIIMSAGALAAFIKLENDSFIIGDMLRFGANYIFGGEMIGKIAEAEPLIYDKMTLMNLVFSPLGLNILFSLAGLVVLIFLVKNLDSGNKKGQLLFLVWAIIALVLMFGQFRFLYLSNITMGILISLLFFWILDRAMEVMAEKGQKLPNLVAFFLLLVVILPTAVDAAMIIQSESPFIAVDWYDTLIWLRDNSNSTSYYDNPEKSPEYSVMSYWDYGNWIVYISKRPVVANNFQAGALDSTNFFLSDSEESATAILDARKSRYILTDYDIFFDRFSSLAKWGDFDPSEYIGLDESGSRVRSLLKPKLFNTTMARLYLFDGAGMGHFRLIYESRKSFITDPPSSRIKIFEYVPGALIKVKASPDQKVGALLNLTSNQGRTIAYINEGRPVSNGEYEIRVAYSTEKKYGFKPLGSYFIFSGNKQSVRTHSINVSEQDVLEGRTIEVNFGAN